MERPNDAGLDGHCPTDQGVMPKLHCFLHYSLSVLAVLITALAHSESEAQIEQAYLTCVRALSYEFQTCLHAVLKPANIVCTSKCLDVVGSRDLSCFCDFRLQHLPVARKQPHVLLYCACYAALPC